MEIKLDKKVYVLLQDDSVGYEQSKRVKKTLPSSKCQIEGVYVYSRWNWSEVDRECHSIRTDDLTLLKHSHFIYSVCYSAENKNKNMPSYYSKNRGERTIQFLFWNFTNHIYFYHTNLILCGWVNLFVLVFLFL